MAWTLFALYLFHWHRKTCETGFDIPEVKCLAFYSSLRVALDLDPLIQTGLVILNQVGCQRPAIVVVASLEALPRGLGFDPPRG